MPWNTAGARRLTAFCSRSQERNSTTTVLRHIQTGKRRNPPRACSALPSPGKPCAQRFARSASGQSASTTTPLKPCSAISRCVIRARSR